jgi:hypothetical protein
MKTLLRFVRGIYERVCLVVMGPSAVRYQLEAMMRDLQIAFRLF